MTHASYAVVGGGISGLVAAYRLRVLAGPDAQITIFDPADRLGGTLRTTQLGDQIIDIGAEAFVTRRPEVPELLAELGLTARQRGTTGVRPLLYADTTLHALPAGTVNGIPSTAESMAPLVDQDTLDRMIAEPGRPLHWQPGSDPTVAELVGERFGPQVLARSVDPMVGGVYAGSSATIGLRAAAPTVAGALDHGAPSLTEAVRRALPPNPGAPVFGSIDGGYRVLIEELLRRSAARWVPSEIQALRPAGAGWIMHDDNTTDHRVDAVVLAMPAHQLAVLVAELAPDSARAASRIDIASSVVVGLAIPRGSSLPQSSGVLVGTGEPLHAKAITLSSRKWGSPDESDVELLRLSFGRFGDPAALVRDTPDDQLLNWALADLRAVFDIEIDPVDVVVQRWVDAMPQYGPHHGDIAAQIRRGLPTGLAVAGNFLDGIGVPACVAAGNRAAAVVAV